MKIKNIYVKPVLEFLDTLNLSGLSSIGRTKLKEKLMEHNYELVKDQNTIIDEYEGWIDKEKGEFTTQNPELLSAINQLFNEEVEIAYDSPFKQDFVQALKEDKTKWSGVDADAYALLYEELIEATEE